MPEKELRRSFIKKSVVATAGFSFGMSILNTSCIDKGNTIKWRNKGRTISFDYQLPAQLTQVEVRLFTDANKYIFEYDDVSPHAPKVENEQTKDVWMPGYDEEAIARKQSSREQRFLVIDLAFKQAMEALITFDVNEPGEYNFNKQGKKPISKEVRIPAAQLEHWANALIIDPKSNSINSFSLASK